MKVKSLWKHYFGPKCVVYGVDIEEVCKSYEDDSIKIYIGDKADRKFWKRLKSEVDPIDILVDDGGHKTHQQIVTLEEMFPHLRPGGVYLCEDVTGEFNRFHSYIHGLTRNLDAFDLNGEHTCTQPNAFQRLVHSVHLYPFVVVLEKSDSPVSKFINPRRGTQWQPFL